MKLNRNPMCENKDGRVATEVDHIIALRLGGRNNLSNLRALCKPCHSRKTRAVDMPRLQQKEREEDGSQPFQS